MISGVHVYLTYLSFGVDLEVPRCEVLVALQVDVEAGEVDVALVKVQQHLLRGEAPPVVVQLDRVVLQARLLQRNMHTR